MMRKAAIVLGTSSLWFAATVAHAQLDLGAEAVTSVTGAAAGELAGAATGAAADVQIQSKLNQQMSISGVTSEIRNGVATLHGTVNSQAEKDRAEQLASRVQGVTRVRNQITVEGDASAAAHGGNHVASPALDAAVLANLNTDARFAGRGINVSSNNRNVITLTGEVSSEADKALAGRIAAETHAVAEVRNRLVVRAQ